MRDGDCASGEACVDGSCQAIAFISTGVPDAARSSVEVDRSSLPADGAEVALVEVTLRDEVGLPAMPVEVQLVVTGVDARVDGSMTSAESKKLSDMDGRVTFSLSARQVGAASVGVTWQTPAGAKGPIEPIVVDCVQAQPDPSKSTVTFSKKSNILADGRDETLASVALVTAAGGIPYGSALSFEVTGDGVVVDPPMVAVDSEGKADVAVRSRLSGMKTVVPRVNDLVSLPAEMVSFSFAPVSVGSTSVVYTQTQATADLADAIEITIIVPTLSSGASREVDIDVEVTGTDNPVEDVATLDEPVSRRVLLRSSKAEQKTVTVKVMGAQQASAPPQNVTFVAGPAAEPQSTFVLDTDRTSINQPIAFTLRSRDKFDNIRAADPVTLTATGLTVTPAGALVTDGNGELSGTLVSGAIVDTNVTASFGGVSATRSLRFQTPWQSTEPSYVSGSSKFYLYDPADISHLVMCFNGSRGAVFESFDMGRTFSPVSTDGLPGPPYSYLVRAISPGSPPRLWARGTDASGSRPFFKDPGGPWQELSNPPAISASTEFQDLAVGGPDKDVVYLVYAGCHSGDCTLPGTGFVMRQHLVRHSGTQNAVFDSTPFFPAGGTTAGWDRSDYFRVTVDDADSQIAYVHAFSYAVPFPNPSSLQETVDRGTFIASPPTQVDLMSSDAWFFVPDASASDGVAALVDVDELKRIRRAGNTFETTSLSPPAATTFFGSPLASYVSLANMVVSASQASIATFVPGTGWELRPVEHRFFGSFPASAGLDRLGVNAAAKGVEFVPHSGLAYVAASEPVAPDDTFPFVAMPNGGIVVRGDRRLAYYNGQSWFNMLDTLVKPTSMVAGFGDVFFEVVGGVLYERHVLTRAATAVTTAADSTPITGAQRVFHQRSPDKRYLLATSGIYSRGSSTGWVKIAAAPPGSLTNRFIAIDAQSNDIFADEDSNSIYRYTSSWASVAVTNMAGNTTAFFADPRAPGTLYMQAGTKLFKKPAGSPTFSEFAAVSVYDIDFSDSDASKIVTLSSDGTRTLDGGALPAASACAVGGLTAQARFDPFNPRRLVNATLENYARCH